MKPWIPVATSVVASVLASLVAVELARQDPTARSDDGPVLERLARMQATVDELSSRQAQLAEAVRAEEPRPVEPAAARVAVDEIEQAVARWMEENAAKPPPRQEGVASRAAESAPSDGLVEGIEAASLEDILEALIVEGDLDFENNALWEALRESGRIDEVLAEFERMAAEDPTNPDLQVAVGAAYIQKLFGVGSSPLAGELAMKADAAFDRALVIDDTHWDARFAKAVSLSNWPAFLGKSGEAIRHFEILIDQQSRTASRPEFSETYLILGNMYLQTGKQDQALQIWRDGLALFPDDEDLRRQIDFNAR